MIASAIIIATGHYQALQLFHLCCCFFTTVAALKESEIAIKGAPDLVLLLYLLMPCLGLTGGVRTGDGGAELPEEVREDSESVELRGAESSA